MPPSLISALWPIFLLGGVALVAFLYRRVYWVGDRTAEDVLAFLRPVGSIDVEELFSAESERYLRINLNAQQFRRAQRNRIILALECMRRISHNALILQQWASYEMARVRTAANRESSDRSMDLIAASIHCRVFSLVLRLRLHGLLFRMALLPFTTPPSFARLIHFAGADLLAFYTKMRVAAGDLGRCYGEAHQGRLAELL